jgi:hypothetical protein
MLILVSVVPFSTLKTIVYGERGSVLIFALPVLGFDAIPLPMILIAITYATTV